MNEGKDEKRNSDVINMTTKGFQYEEESEEKIEDEWRDSDVINKIEEDEWRLPRDNWKKVAWLKPLTSSSCNNNHLAILHFITIFIVCSIAV